MLRGLLFIHLLAVVAFFSNLIAAYFWKARADRTREPAVVAHTFRTLNAGDLWITPVSTVAIVASGIGAALVTGLPMLGTGWVLWSIVSFSASGLVFGVWVIPRQLRLARWATASVAAGSFDWQRYERDARGWARWAHLSLWLALVAMLLMVLKPALPAW